MTSTEQQRVEEIAKGLSKVAEVFLRGFESTEIKLYADIPFAGRLECFEAGLLIGAEINRAGRRQYGCRLTPLGLAVRTHLQEQAS